MQPANRVKIALVLGLGLSALFVPPARSQAQREPASLKASNIVPADTRSDVAPSLPIPPVQSSDPPAAFLWAARRAVQAGRSGEAQEALERAETRLLDRVPSTFAVSLLDNQRAVLAICTARRTLAAHDVPATVASIDAALGAISPPGQALVLNAPLALSQPPVVLVPGPPVTTHALLPGRWELHGARYVWTPPDTVLRPVRASVQVPGRYVWRDGSYGWVPAHYEP